MFLRSAPVFCGAAKVGHAGWWRQMRCERCDIVGSPWARNATQGVAATLFRWARREPWRRGRGVERRQPILLRLGRPRPWRSGRASRPWRGPQAAVTSASIIVPSALDPCRKAELIEARPHFCKRFVHSPGRRPTNRRDISRHGVALLCGMSTPSLPAQGGQRRPLQVTLFLEAHKRLPRQIILDLDATDDPYAT